MRTRFIVAAVVGIVVGVVTYNPAAGFAAFSAVYGVTGFLDPNTKVQGPRLQDLKFPSASYGSPIPYVEGHPRVPGIIVWSIDPKREVASTVTQSSKGGPAVDSTSFTYEVDMRIVLCENTGYRPRRCWSNGALIWSAAEDADDETIQASAETVSWRELRTYTGDDDQMPDPTEEAYVGAGLSPAYRGRSSIVIVGLNCGQSGQLPVLTWEISNGAVTPWGVNERILDAPQIADGEDTISPPATLTKTNAGSISYTGSGVLIDRTVVSGSVVQKYDTDRMNLDDYTGLPVTLSVLVKPGLTVGFGLPGDNLRFLTFANGGDEQSWGLRIVSIGGEPSMIAYTFFQREGVSAVGHEHSMIGVTIDELGFIEFKIVFTPATDSDPETVQMWMGGAIFQTYVGERSSGSVSLWLANAGGQRVGSILAKNLLMYAGDGTDASLDLVALEEPTHAEALTRQWERAGLDSALLDVSAPDLSTLLVRALAISQLSPPRTTMDNLAASGLYEFVETGDGVKVVMRGGSPVKTIEYEDLGAFNGDTPPDPLPRTRGNELEVTSQVSIKFANVDDDYRDGTETSTRLATGSSIVTVAEVPMGLTPTEAKRLADVAVTDALSSIMRIGPVVLTRKHADIEPTDVVIFTGKDGSTYRTRITKRTEGAGIITLEGVAVDATVIDSAAVTSAGYTSTSSVRAFSPTDPTYIDGPLIDEGDNSRGFYVAGRPTGEKFSSWALLKSSDDVDFNVVAAGLPAAVKGECSVVPGDWPTRTFNERDSIVCDLGAAGAAQVAGTTREVILASKSANAFLIGTHGRWLFGQFRDVELVSEGVVKLTGLLLGDLGTEHNIGTQIVGDEFVLLDSRVRRVQATAGDMGVSRYYKAVSYGRSVAGTDSETFTENEVGLKPVSPVYLRGDRDGSGDIDLRWTRRTRAATITAGPSAPIVPLLEEGESYSIDIFDDDTYTTVVRTLTSTTPSVTYSAADQTTDFGSAQAVIYARVYQISALVGRGFPLEAAA